MHWDLNNVWLVAYNLRIYRAPPWASPPNLLTTTTTKDMIKIMTTTPNSAKKVVAFPKKDVIPLETLPIISVVPLAANELAGETFAAEIAPSTIKVTTPMMDNESNVITNALTLLRPRIPFFFGCRIDFISLPPL